MRLALLIFTGLLLGWCGRADAHAVTFSHVVVTLKEGETRIQADISVQALLQQQPPVLSGTVPERMLSAGPISAPARAQIAALVARSLRVRSSGETVPIRILSVRPAGDHIEVTASAAPVRGALELEANPFPDDAFHKLFVEVMRADRLAGQYVLDHHDTAFTLAAPERPLAAVVLTFVSEGVRHIFIGPDHILFVIALLLLGGTLWRQVKILSAFTVAHSVTLVLATLGILNFPSQLVESAIALSIIVVGLHDLRQLRSGTGVRAPGRDPRVVFAFAFGLVHGLGFASVLRELALPRGALAWSLAAFNVGVEIGQVAILLVAAPLLAALRRFAAPRPVQAVLTSAAASVTLAGAVWLCQRTFGL